VERLYSSSELSVEPAQAISLMTTSIEFAAIAGGERKISELKTTILNITRNADNFLIIV